MNLSSVKPENVQLETSAVDDKACLGDVISINCSADAVPSEISYQLLENDTAISDDSGTWSRPLTTAGVFNYQCVPNNTVGTGDNASVIVTVNGKGNAKNDKMLSSRVYRKWRHGVIQFTSSVVQYIVSSTTSFLSLVKTLRTARFLACLFSCMCSTCRYLFLVLLSECTCTYTCRFFPCNLEIVSKLLEITVCYCN